jgi:hypothetical protein
MQTVIREEKNAGVGFEVSTAMAVKSTVFWVVTPCISELA